MALVVEGRGVSSQGRCFGPTGHWRSQTVEQSIGVGVLAEVSVRMIYGPPGEVAMAACASLAHPAPSQHQCSHTPHATPTGAGVEEGQVSWQQVGWV